VNAARKRTIASYVFAIAFGAAGGFSLWYWGAPNPHQLLKRTEGGTTSITGEGAKALTGQAAVDQAGLAYARAVQTGNCEDVIDLTWWMQERLEYVRMRGGDPEAVAAARDALCSGLLDRTPEGNQLSPEGIEDKYLLQQDATIEAVAVETGGDALEKPVSRVVWLRVTYGDVRTAPRGEGGRPLKSLLAGVPVSADGYVLKGGVRGNLVIDWDSIAYDWGPAENTRHAT
jgi:hypothetical protein